MIFHCRPSINAVMVHKNRYNIRFGKLKIKNRKLGNWKIENQDFTTKLSEKAQFVTRSLEQLLAVQQVDSELKEALRYTLIFAGQTSSFGVGAVVLRTRQRRNKSQR